MNNIPKEDLLFYLHILFQGYPKGSFGWMWKVGNILIYDLLMCILISEQGWMLETTASCQSLPLTSTKLKQRILFLRCLDPVSNKSLKESANWLSYSSPDIRCSRICPPLSRHTLIRVLVLSSRPKTPEMRLLGSISTLEISEAQAL